MPESPTDLPRGYQYPEGNARADPSALTVAMLDKAIGQVREFYDAQLKELRDGLKTAHDDEALAHAKRLCDGTPKCTGVELWCGAQRIGAYKPTK